MGELDRRKMDPRYVLTHVERVFPYLRWRYPRLLAPTYLGLRHRCDVCGARLRRFAMHYTTQEGPGTRELCPFCKTLCRTRQLRRLLQQEYALEGARVLHVAPEPWLERWLRDAGAEVTTTDLNLDRVDLQASLTELPVDDDRFDLVICSHVLEHIPEDRAAMSELARVVAPGGRALIMVPLKGAITDEDLSVTDERERERRFGQHDHVRFYGDDIEDRLSAAGFEVHRRALPTALKLPLATCVRLGLEREDVLFDCRVGERV